MKAKFTQSWGLAGFLLISLFAATNYVSGTIKSDTYMTPRDLIASIVFTSIPLMLSAGLNALYDMRGYAATQRVWMLSPKSLIGKIGYILSGAAALVVLFVLGICLVYFVFALLYGVGQAAWQT